MLKLRKNKKGFTLVELIVVVAIMAVLAGTVAGVVVSTQNKTKNQQAASSAQGIAKQLATMLNTDYQSSTQEYFTLTADGKPSGYKAESGTFSYAVLNDLAKGYDSGAITNNSDVKAGSNKYCVAVTSGTTTIKVSFKALGGGSGAKSYEVSYDIDSDTFKVSEVSASK